MYDQACNFSSYIIFDLIYLTEQIVEEFQKGVGKELQAKLQDRANQTTNWVGYIVTYASWHFDAPVGLVMNILIYTWENMSYAICEQ